MRPKTGRGAHPQRMRDGALLEVRSVVLAVLSGDLPIRTNVLNPRRKFSCRPIPQLAISGLGEGRRRRSPRHRPLEDPGASCSGDGRGAPVAGVAQRRILARDLLVLNLRRSRSDVLLAGEGPLCRCRSRSHPSLPSVVADIRNVSGPVDCDRSVVSISDMRISDIGHGGVVVECAVVPVATGKPGAAIAEPIIDAAVETDGSPPVAGIENVGAVRPSPISRCPQQSYAGRQHPCARQPKVIHSVPRPVARSPDVPGAGIAG